MCFVDPQKYVIVFQDLNCGQFNGTFLKAVVCMLIVELEQEKGKGELIV